MCVYIKTSTWTPQIYSIFVSYTSINLWGGGHQTKTNKTKQKTTKFFHRLSIQSPQWKPNSQQYNNWVMLAAAHCRNTGGTSATGGGCWGTCPRCRRWALGHLDALWVLGSGEGAHTMGVGQWGSCGCRSYQSCRNLARVHTGTT